MKLLDSSPWLSVVMPVYQGETYLESALQSIADQGKTDDIEIIVIDDGSTDQSRKIVERWSRTLPIELVEQTHDGNWIRSTNRALSQAQGVWVSLLHQDDCWLPGRLDTLRCQMTDHPDVDFWLHPALFIDEQGKRIGRWRCPLPAHHQLDAADTLPRLVVQNFIPIVSPVVRRKKVLEVGGLDESLWYFGDWNLWLKLAAISTLYYIAKPLAAFRVHAQSQTALRTADLEDIGHQFDVTVNQTLESTALPADKKLLCRRTASLARGVYLFLLGGLHGRGVGCWQLLCLVCRARPSGIWHYWRHSCIVGRLLPRLKLYFHSHREKRT